MSVTSIFRFPSPAAECCAPSAAVSSSPGYSPGAEFGGFETRRLTNVRVRAGDNRQGLSLAIQRIETGVVVGQDKDAAASDRRTVTFGSMERIRSRATDIISSRDAVERTISIVAVI